MSSQLSTKSFRLAARQLLASNDTVRTQGSPGCGPVRFDSLMPELGSSTEERIMFRGESLLSGLPDSWDLTKNILKHLQEMVCLVKGYTVEVKSISFGCNKTVLGHIYYISLVRFILKPYGKVDPQLLEWKNA